MSKDEGFLTKDMDDYMSCLEGINNKTVEPCKNRR